MKLGVDVERFLSGIEYFDLLESSNGLLSWSPLVPADGLFYEQLSHCKWYYEKEKEEFKFAKPFVFGKSLLEIGCGSGFFADIAECSYYVGLELNKKAARVAMDKGHHVMCLSFAEYAESHPESFDVVCSFQLLEHLVDPSEYFRASFRLLKPGGILITSVPSHDSFVGCLNENILNTPPHHLTCWKDETLRSFPSSFGYECMGIHHLALDKEHHKWFLSCLLLSGFSPGYPTQLTPPSTTSRVKLKIVLFLLSLLGSSFMVPPCFRIPGHTVVSIHRKSLSDAG